MTSIWDPIRVGRMALNHRLALAPMTRSRALADGTPGPLAAEYYAQRASLGLLIAEGTQPSEDGQGYMTTPGIHTDAHVAGWRRVADAVHDKGGHLFIQVMHAGRISHPANTPHHRQALAPSAVAPAQQMFTPQGMLPIPAPRAMTQADIEMTVADFASAAARAVDAGAEGVELHGANGYLIQQFLGANTNVRTDAYGGSIPNRARFALEVAAAVADRIGADRTGIRLSPGSRFNDIDEGPESGELNRYLVAELAKLGLAYLHISHHGDEALLADIRRLWPNVLLVNRGGRPLAAVGADVESGLADMAPVGVWALANPDLPDRLRRAAPLNDPDPATFYGGDAKGYTDYPPLDAAAA